jgi:hypothetical protein
MQCSHRLREFKVFVHSCITFFHPAGIPTAILMEAGTTLQAQATFTMRPHPKAEEITIRAAKATGLNAERASRFRELLWISSPTSLSQELSNCP